MTLAGCWHAAPTAWPDQQTLGSSAQLKRGSGLLMALNIPLIRDPSSVLNIIFESI